MKIVCVSDTHTYGSEVRIPDGDVLIHAGDHTFRGSEREVSEALEWLESLPHKRKVIIAGNHDFYFDLCGERVDRVLYPEELLSHFPSVTYLEDSSVTIDGVKLYGSPWQPWFHDWAFNFSEGAEGKAEADAAWQKIPEDTDVLITHGPPFNILDRTETGENVGCPNLRHRLTDMPNLKLHVFGHIHEGYGKMQVGNTLFVNASVNTRRYRPTNEPIVIDLAA